MPISRLIRKIFPPAPDARGRRFVAVIECALNQNLRDVNAAVFPAMNFALLQLCQQHAVGVLPMPCPEIAALGVERRRAPGQSLRAALDSGEARACCCRLAAETAARIAAHASQGNRLLAVLGGNPRSPGCAVHHGESALAEASGVFMKPLQAELRARGHEVPFHAVRDADPAALREDLAWLEAHLSGTADA